MKRPSSIVGVAASAGGLDAFSSLLKSLPVDSGMAFIFFQHLDPSHESLLASLLSKSTVMPVREVLDGCRVLRDHVYIIPPNKGMFIAKGSLHLVPRGKKFRPIDHFFESLSRDQGERAIGVVLSGEASDGTAGLEAIKARGGITFAQNEATAQHVGMPRSAAASGCVDFVLSPVEIGRKLARMGRAGAFAPPSEIAVSRGKEYLAILDRVRRAKGVDFSDYKPGTINRRIRRRMAVRGIQTLARYAKDVARNPRELDALASDFLIHVTSFFRDPKVFKALRTKVYPALLKSRPPGEAIRIWVTGCSTGEEAYSHCINLLEFLERGADRTAIQVFATDISEDAVKKARVGVYSEKSVHGLSPLLRAKYFAKVAHGYQINKTVRDLCVFAKQNVVEDTPFSRLDLVSCRNVLIYLGPGLQKKALGMFHYALKPSGFLLLGEAESIDVARDRFGAVDAKHRIFSNKPFKGMDFISYAAKRGPRAAPAAAKRIERRLPDVPEMTALDLPREIDRLLLKRFTPATIVVDGEFFILQFRGPINRYLEPLSGKASLNLSKMALEDLRLELMAAVDKSKKTGDSVKKEGIEVRRDGRAARVDFEVWPIKGANPSERCWAIVISDSPAAAADSVGTGARASDSRRVLRLKRELGESHEALQSLMEQHEISNQELASTQEESTAHNEELRSLNEELETAKEELQSTNEELTTINDELNVRNRELILAGEFSEAVLDTVREPLLVLEEDLRVKSANRSFYRTFNLSRGDTEAHFIYALAGGQWDLPKLRNLLDGTLHTSKIRDDLELDQDLPGLGRRLLRYTVRRIHDEDAGGQKRVLLAIDDVTVQRELEELEALRKRDELRREFVAHVSHQFRTPLTAIRSCAETLRKTAAKDAEGANFIGMIERHAIRLARLVDDLLSLSVLETVPTSAHEKIALAPFTRDFVKSIEPLIHAQRVSFGVKIPEGLRVRADKTLLRQVLNNLCTNAIKYSPRGGKIDLSARAGDGDVVISIQDRGIGIPRREQSRIFEPFYRGQRARAADATGTGLGLSIARKIVEFFGGRIWLESRGGKGSRFSFTVTRA